MKEYIYLEVGEESMLAASVHFDLLEHGQRRYEVLTGSNVAYSVQDLLSRTAWFLLLNQLINSLIN